MLTAASKQDPAQRAAWREAMADVAAEDRVFVDESGANVRLTRAYARAPHQECGIDQAVATVTAQDARVCFHSCGYSLAQ